MGAVLLPCPVVTVEHALAGYEQVLPDIRERVERRLAPLTNRQRQYLLATAKLSPSHFATLVVFFSVRQAIVPDHVLGHVTAAVRLIAAGALPLGAALGGMVANILSITLPRVRNHGDC